ESTNSTSLGNALPGYVKGILQEALPVPGITISQDNSTRNVASPPLKKSGNTEKLPEPRVQLSALSQPEISQEGPITGESLPYLEIEVKHGEHTFTLFSNLGDGRRQPLYHCRVGLGGPGFPTPVGTYFVTHIYDDNPWWIPPKDRAWAAGDKPSKRVYGGTMAPLLKKRDVRSKKEVGHFEDKVSGPVKLEDYGYRFHGTNSPRSIGHNQSHGCVRMLPDDAKKVAVLIKDHVGTIDRRESENGSFVILKSPVRLNLLK
ncbi:MAG: L,D-transpeptidase ErfK/SrfK, partial [Thermodesulfobacteriota bacterium]|nr:L,D-transpeptidase ErfK/SrfK [Thermodesulfobacteriota bacterium]